MLHGQDRERVGEDTDDDGGDAVEQIGGVADDEGKSFPAEFGEIDAGEQAYGQAHDCSEKEQLEAADDGAGHAGAGFFEGFGELREEFPTERRAAVPDQVSEDEKQHRDDGEGGNTGQGEHDEVQRLAPGHAQRAHAGRPPPRSVATIKIRARPFRMKVMRKRTRPSSISELRYKSPVASVN